MASNVYNCKERGRERGEVDTYLLKLIVIGTKERDNLKERITSVFDVIGGF